MRHPILGTCLAVLLCGLGLAPTARAQNAAWIGTTSAFDAASNWSPAAVPTGTAFFGPSGVPDLTYTGKTVLGGFTFDPGAQAFTFTSTRVTTGVILEGAGIVDNSRVAPVFSNRNGGRVPADSGLIFTNNASAGTARIGNADGGITLFARSSTAGNSIIVNRGGTALLSGSLFTAASSAGNAHITNDTNGIAQFNDRASAGNAVLVNRGGSVTGFRIARFIDALLHPDTVAPSAFDVGATAFRGPGATAGNARITNDNGGVTAFLLDSTAGSATIVTNAGGGTFFTGASSGGTATLIVGGGGILDLTMHDPGVMTAGSLVQAPGSLYRVAVSPDQNTVLALGGTATLQGAVLQLVPVAANYGRNPTVAIISAAGGVDGAFGGIDNSFAFLTPTLGYDAKTVHLGLSQSFARGGRTANQRAVGGALDQSASSATGDLDTVIGALAVLDPVQGPQALNRLSGQPYADFATVNVQMGYAFANAVSAQIAAIREGTPAARVALAQTCGAACQTTSSRTIGAWISPLGGTGSVLGDGNAATLTYVLGGVAAGADYRVDSRTIIGASVGYLTGTQWVDGFDGRGTTDALGVGLYASFASAGFYVDALAGYASATNRLTRAIAIPGLATRTAFGQANASQFLGQVETGYRIALNALAPALSVTPFARLQGATIDQPGFAEGGAGSLNLLVASQTTTSLRSTLGADLVAKFGPVDLDLRLGWLHEHGSTNRPMTAAFSGAPGFSYTVLGATSPRDSAVLGLSATARVADATRIYLRYEGELGGGTDIHALTLGVRLSW